VKLNPSTSSTSSIKSGIVNTSLTPISHHQPASSALSLNSMSGVSSPSQRDLWREALEKLPESTQEKLKPNNDQKSQQEHIQDLLKITKERQKECESKFLKFSVGKHEIIVRDYSVKIVGWLQKAGDIAIQFAPPQASMPWSIVKQVMQVRTKPTFSWITYFANYY
jgi:ankyrin repeat domain-containing protein 50